MVIVGFSAVHCVQNCTEMKSGNATFFPKLLSDLWGASSPQPELLKQLFWQIHCCPARKHRCFVFKFGFGCWVFFFKCCVSRLHWPSLSHSLQNLNSKSPICWEVSEEFSLLLFSLLKTDQRKSYNAQATDNIYDGQGKFLSDCLEESTVLFNSF